MRQRVVTVTWATWLRWRIESRMGRGLRLGGARWRWVAWYGWRALVGWPHGRWSALRAAWWMALRQPRSRRQP